MRSLLRASQLLALAAILAVVAALALLYRGLVLESLIENETRSNIALTRAFINATWPAHAGFIARAGSLPPKDLPLYSDLREIERDLRRLSQGIPIVKVKIYDLRGVTVFSS